MNQAEIRLKFDKDTSNLIYRSLEPELRTEQGGSEVEMFMEEEGLKLTINANDLSIMRAALNSYIRWIDCIFSINEVIKTEVNKQ